MLGHDQEMLERIDKMKNSAMRRLFIACSLLAGPYCALVSAQTPESQARIEASVTQSIAAPENTVEMSLESNVLTIRRVNSAMNGSTHQGYMSEARAVALSVTSTIKDDPDYSKIVSIRVDYIYRTGVPSHDKIMDSVEFRKNSKGSFDLHLT